MLRVVPQALSLNWQWPHPGPIIDTYSVTGRINKGLILWEKSAIRFWQPRKERWFYAGSGLIGYGLLIIINHSDDYLSAYAQPQDSR